MTERTENSVVLHIAQWVPVTEAEGPGKRFAVWFQGCPLRCAGCCNPEMLPFAGGAAWTVNGLLGEIDKVRCEIEGITLLGGEPFAHAHGAALLARQVRSWGLSVMVFSGFTLEEIQAMAEPAAGDLLAHTDILVDGPYCRELPETRRRWIGSANQRVHFLSDRCRVDDPRWHLPNTLEIRWHDGELSVNGFPARSAVGLWRRPSFAVKDQDSGEGS